MKNISPQCQQKKFKDSDTKITVKKMLPDQVLVQWWWLSLHV